LSLAFQAFFTDDCLRSIKSIGTGPCSFADAWIVRMAENHEWHAVLTLDSDFAVYRKDGRTPLALIRPAQC
jgi:predicted nucleic acid-binding protein